ncbi:hypothetical protein [Aeromicrobium fastidiosum]|uniref:PH domain-containing protein n=1 Tax=Aeromicrobium fastidiosum TaxID=52699 RepID=A0A641APC2_9ACTN|nr:hypothetical protein [Aeromicrobium fastidiosum]KAA1379946.1 hypothetical protein ESP62_001665 [Aeromicrobium fastidiosum]
MKAAGAAVLVAGPVGAVGFINIGPEVGIPVAAVTAVVTVAILLVVRLTLPTQLTVTVTPSDITMRSYGRTRTIVRDERTRAAAMRLLLQWGIASNYLVVAGTGRPFKLNIDMWADEDLADLLTHIPVQCSEPLQVTPKEAQREFPGLLGFGVVHPNRAAVLAVVAFIVLVLAVYGVITALGSGDDGDDRASAEPTYSARPQAADLSREAGGTQNRLQSDVQRLLGDDEDWEPADTTTSDCSTGGYSRIVSWTNRSPRYPYTQDDRAAVALAAAEADLQDRDVRLDGDAVVFMKYANDTTGATLTVAADEGAVTVTTASACTGLE